MLKNILLLFIPILVIAYASRKQRLKYFSDLLSKARYVEIRRYKLASEDFTLQEVSDRELQQITKKGFDAEGRVVYSLVDDCIIGQSVRTLYAYDQSGVLLSKEIMTDTKLILISLAEQESDKRYYQVFRDGQLDRNQNYIIEEKGNTLTIEKSDEHKKILKFNKYGQTKSVVYQKSDTVNHEEHYYKHKRRIESRITDEAGQTILITYQYTDFDKKGNWLACLVYYDGEPTYILDRTIIY